MTCINKTQKLIAERESKISWEIIGLSLLAFIVLFIGILFYCNHKRNLKQASAQAKKLVKKNEELEFSIEIKNKNIENSSEESKVSSVKESEI